MCVWTVKASHKWWQSKYWWNKCSNFHLCDCIVILKYHKNTFSMRHISDKKKSQHGGNTFGHQGLWVEAWSHSKKIIHTTWSGFWFEKLGDEASTLVTPGNLYSGVLFYSYIHFLLLITMSLGFRRYCTINTSCGCCMCNSSILPVILCFESNCFCKVYILFHTLVTLDSN